MTAIDPLSLTFTGAEVLGPDGLSHDDVSMTDGIIVSQAETRIDASGYLMLPGIIDLHGDGFERHLAARRGAQLNPGDGLPAVEAELAASGITTAMLAQFYSWEGGMRSPEFAERVITALGGYNGLTDMRMQLRVEYAMHNDYAAILQLVADHGIGYVVLNDHLNHAKLAAGKRTPRLVGQALKSGRSPEAHLALMQGLHADMPAARAALPEFCAALKDAGVRLGSHDDHTPEDRATFREVGADIAEFPETRAAAEAAHQAGEPVIMGAPNVVRGNSHDGKVSAGELVHAGLVDALVSDYHYAAIHRAALRLWDEGLPLHTAWGLISTGPARVMGWTDRGQLTPGLRADITVMNAQSRRIEGTFAAGRATYLTGGLARRMIAGQLPCG